MKPQRLSTASGKEGADAKQALGGLELKGWNAVIALTASVGLMWEITYRFHQAEVARIMGEAEAKRNQDKLEVDAKRNQDKLEVDAKNATKTSSRRRQRGIRTKRNCISTFCK